MYLCCDGMELWQRTIIALCIIFSSTIFKETMDYVAPVVAPFPFLHLFLACVVLVLGLQQRRLEVGTVVCAMAVAHACHRCTSNLGNWVI